ncbi:MAG: M28 family peptidase [Winogradskyella sp.]|uniref:M28 family peptidase n=1 Tax=Winogradskyella sp. TaxID=1883156 RepID=UPI0017AC642C|nr:M28 family peptidase [Winogradskyella sp.]
MKLKLIFLLLVMACTSISCAQNNAISFDEDKLLERMEILSSDKFEGRRTGEKGNDSARAYIIEQFKALGVSGYNGTFEYPFLFEVRNREFNATNIVAEIKGSEYPEKYIVISAHHDHLGVSGDKIFNGADDDASGVAALFSFAEYLTKYPPKHSVLLVAFDAEEIGLRGAKHFVENFDNDKILVNLNMDMISRSAKNELYVVGARYNPALASILDDFESPNNTKVLQGHDGTDGKQDWTMSSDHGPFHMADIPFLYFGNEDHKAYHKANDVFEDITPQFYKNAVAIILSIFKSIDAVSL